MPPEAKNTKKQKAGKIGAEAKSKKREAVILVSGTSNSDARTGLAENDPVSQNEDESSRFRNEDDSNSLGNEHSESDKIAKPKSDDDGIIETTKSSIEGQPEQKDSDVDSSCETLLLPSVFVKEIHDLVDVAQKKGYLGIPEFRLWYNRRYVTEIKISL
jgi:hypothetical protein